MVLPSSLTRVGPDRRQADVRYDNMAHKDWVELWLQADYGRKSKIVWDSNRNSNIWENFEQVAYSKDGASNFAHGFSSLPILLLQTKGLPWYINYAKASENNSPSKGPAKG